MQVSKKEVKVGEEFEVFISFTNPVKVDLTALEVNLEGPGISNSKELCVGYVSQRTNAISHIHRD